MEWTVHGTVKILDFLEEVVYGPDREETVAVPQSWLPNNFTRRERSTR